MVRKNKSNGLRNPLAQMGAELTDEQIAASVAICDPLQLFDCCPTSDGAAAVVVMARSRVGEALGRPIDVLAAVQTRGAARIAGHPDLCSFDATVSAAQRAFRDAGLQPGEVDVVELHDCFSIAEIIDRVIISGGTAHGAGNVTPVADLNFYCDPLAARHVIREPLTKSLVPLETSSQMMLEFDFLDQLPDEASRAGLLLRRMLPHTFRAHRQLLGSEGVCLHDVVTLVAATNPELFERAAIVADVETAGDLTAGMLVIDRRQVRQQRPNADLFVNCDVPAVKDCILRSLATAAAAT